MAGDFTVILDTCALLWLAQGGGELSADARKRIAGAPAVFVSAISAFEIGIKCRKGKLTLPARPDEWLETVLTHHGIRVIPVDARIAMAATELPEIHGDPCDRMIIASAKAMNLPVVTADLVFRKYGIEVLA